MSRTLNLFNKQIISKEEIRAWDSDIRKTTGNVLSNLGTKYGILSTAANLSTNDYFEVSLGSNPSPAGKKTLKIKAGKGIVDTTAAVTEKIAGLTTSNNALEDAESCLVSFTETDNITIGDDSGYSAGVVLYAGVVPVYNPMLEGICSISTSGQVTIANGDFLDIRGQENGVPSKVRFYLENGSAANNNQTYEVINVIDSTNINISGLSTLLAETNVRMVIVGSYDLSLSGSLADKYSYVTLQLEPYFNADGTEFTDKGGFVLARLNFSANDTFTITDTRTSVLFNFVLPSNVVYTDTTQTITGNKTLTGVVNITNELNLSALTSITNEVYNGYPDYLVENATAINLSNGVNNVLIDLATNTNQLFLLKAASGAILSTFNFTQTDTLTYGRRFYIRVDPTGEDLKINLKNTSNYFVDSSFDVKNGMILKKGSIIEVVRVANGAWFILNHNILKPPYSEWTLIPNGLIKNYVGDPSNVNNVWYIKAEGNTIYINVEKFYVVNTEGNFVYVDLGSYYPELFSSGYPTRKSVKTYEFADNGGKYRYVAYDSSTKLLTCNTNDGGNTLSVGLTLTIA